MEAFKKSVTSSVLPIPTVLPPPPIYENAGDSGHRTLWVVCVVMGISSLAFYAMAFRVPASKRLFHVLTAIITTIAFISYFAMATGDGISVNHIKIKEKTRKNFPDIYRDVYRQVYWARYVDWLFTTPLLLLDLSLLAGLNGANILVAIFADLVMIVTGLLAATVANNEAKKWGYYTWACIAFLVIFYQLIINGRMAANAKGSRTGKFFVAIGGYTLIVWLLYPIIWGIADGSRTIGVDSEIIAYAVLDILAKPVFGFWLLFTHDAVAETAVNLEGFWAHGLGREGVIRVGDDEDGA